MLIDTHAHLTDARVDAKTVLKDMEQDGLERIISIGYNFQTSLDSLAIAKTDARIFCAIGFHPSNSDEVRDGDLERLRTLSQDERVVAIGEIGLDYHYPDTNKTVQHRVLLQQLDLAVATDLPVVIHLRDAEADMNRILGAHASLLKQKGVLHCFSGSKESALQYLDMGFYISFSGTITFQNAKRLESVVEAVPLNRMLIETDCPYLAPHPFRGQTNYPKYVRHQATRIAQILGISYEEVCKQTRENAYRCFKKLV